MKLHTLRITWLSTRVPTTLLLGGLFEDPHLIIRAWRNPSEAKPLPLSCRYPWLDPKGGPVDMRQWTEWCEVGAFPASPDQRFAQNLVDKAVPLYADTPVTAADTSLTVASLRAEFFLHPWAVSAAVSATLQLPVHSDITAAAAQASAFAAAQFLSIDDVGLADASSPVALSRALATECVHRSGASLDPLSRQLEPVVVATVIDGDPGRSALTRPSPVNRSFSDAMEELAGGLSGSPLRWVKTVTTGDPYCDETRICNVLTTGISQWFHNAIAKRPRSQDYYTTTLHRRAALRLMVLRSIHGLLDRQPLPGDPYWLRDLQDKLVDLLRRYYGLGKPHRDFLGQSYVKLHNLNPVLGNPTSAVGAECP